MFLPFCKRNMTHCAFSLLLITEISSCGSSRGDGYFQSGDDEGEGLTALEQHFVEIIFFSPNNCVAVKQKDLAESTALDTKHRPPCYFSYKHLNYCNNFLSFLCTLFITYDLFCVTAAQLEALGDNVVIIYIINQSAMQFSPKINYLVC